MVKNEKRTTIIFVIVSILLIMGQIQQYKVYNEFRMVLLFDLVFPNVSKGLLIATSIACVISTMLFCTLEEKMDENGFAGRNVILLIYCIAVYLIPALIAFVCLPSFMIASAFIDEKKERDAAIGSTVSFFVASVVLLVIALANKGVGGVDVTVIRNAEEIKNYTNTEVVALDFSKLDNNARIGVIKTSENCEKLVLIGRKRQFFNFVQIETNASTIILKNFNAQDAELKCTSDRCNIELIGVNSLRGKDGGRGYDEDKNGKTALIGKTLVFSGKGELLVIGGKGLDGKDGQDGKNPFSENYNLIFNNGDDGTDGEDGGDSSLVVSCACIEGEDFSGVLRLRKGKVGRGGKGGKGSSGAAIFGHNGKDGKDGKNGTEGAFCSGKVNLVGDNIVYENA